MARTEQALTLSAPDISCAHCVATIESSLGSLDGVRNVRASAETKTVTLEIDPDRTSEQQVRKALDDAGYPAT